MPSLNQLLIAEATEYEFKVAVEVTKPRSWLKTVSAFANGIGGSIYFGVSDDGVAVGLEDPQQAVARISEIIKVRIEPAIKDIVVEALIIDGHEILRVKIPNGANTPYYYMGDGNKVAYYRIGNESAPAPIAVLNELLMKGLNQSFDALETRYRFSDYSYTLFAATYKQKTNNGVDKPKDYQSFNMVSTNGMLTFVGALFADQCPIYQSRVFCTRWNGLKKGGLYVDALDSDEYQGNAISLLADALKFVRHNSSIKWKKTGSGRIEMPDYPSEAVHEALVNALVHRDYMIQGSEIHVDMYDDRLEIVSPGGMADGNLIQDLDIDDVASIRRNPIICDIFSRLKLMERRGSGLRKMVDQYPEDTVPSFRSTAQTFVAALPNLGFCVENGDDGVENGDDGVENGDDVGVDGDDVGVDGDDNGDDVGVDGDDDGDGGVDDGDDVGAEGNIEKILSVMAEEPQITQRDLANRTGLSTRTVSREIKGLRDAGIIRRIGSDRSGYWDITNS